MPFQFQCCMILDYCKAEESLIKRSMKTNLALLMITLIMANKYFKSKNGQHATYLYLKLHLNVLIFSVKTRMVSVVLFFRFDLRISIHSIRSQDDS